MCRRRRCLCWSGCIVVIGSCRDASGSVGDRDAVVSGGDLGDDGDSGSGFGGGGVDVIRGGESGNDSVVVVVTAIAV